MNQEFLAEIFLKQGVGQTEAWHQGFRYSFMGYRSWDNPHLPTEQAWSDFNAGFDACCKEFVSGKPRI